MKINNNSDGVDLLEKEIDLKEIFEIILKGKKLIAIMSISAAFLSMIYAISIPDYYRSHTILVPTDSKELGSISQYSGLASFAGVTLPNSGRNKVAEIIEIIQSREFVKHLISFDEVLPSLMAVESYDKDAQLLIFNDELYNSEKKEWKEDLSSALFRDLSYLKVHEKYIGDILLIDKDSRTGLISISVKHHSPYFAQSFLSLIIREVNNLMRENDIQDSSRAIVYLEKELSQTSLRAMKDSINQLIKSQLETKMLANVNEDYSLKVLEPPFIPENKEGPDRKMIVALWTLSVTFFMIIFVVTRGFLNRN